jgi:Ser/Thr protein kinase RdoA (MazF antagonist)
MLPAPTILLLVMVSLYPSTTQARLGMDLIRLQPFPESNGVINIIFLLHVRDKGGREKRLVLRVANPHPYWARRKTVHEVAIMTHVRRHTTIPVPQVLDHSHNTETSPLGCEYLLLEHMRGVPLSELIDAGAPAEVIARCAPLYPVLYTLS